MVWVGVTGIPDQKSNCQRLLGTTSFYDPLQIDRTAEVWYMVPVPLPGNQGD